MIDIIIPCYKTQDYLHRCLSSIVIQRLIERCRVTCVVDGEDLKPYKAIARKFKPHMDVQVIGYPDNEGPGPCRNYGLNHTSNPFIVFVDSDDVLCSPFAIKILRQEIEDYDMCCAKFYMEDQTQTTICDEWNCLHGKMYKRAFLDKYNIRFGDFKPHEDLTFNHVCGKLSGPTKNVDAVVYARLYREDSTMGQLQPYDDIVKYINSIKWVVTELSKKGAPLSVKERIDAFFSVCLMAFRKDGATTPEILEMVKDYYKDTLSSNEYTSEDISEVCKGMLPDQLATLNDFKYVIDEIRENS